MDTNNYRTPPRPRQVRYLAWACCSVPFVFVGGTFASLCFKHITIPCCTAGTGASCSAGGAAGTIYWTCKGTFDGPAEVDAVTDPGPGQSGQDDHDSGTPQPCVETSRTCGATPNTCVATELEKECVNTFLAGNPCTG